MMESIEIRQLANEIKECASDQREELLNHYPRVIDFFASEHPWKKSILKLVEKEAVVIKQLIAIGQLYV